MRYLGCMKTIKIIPGRAGSARVYRDDISEGLLVPRGSSAAAVLRSSLIDRIAVDYVMRRKARTASSRAYWASNVRQAIALHRALGVTKAIGFRLALTFAKANFGGGR